MSDGDMLSANTELANVMHVEVCKGKSTRCLQVTLKCIKNKARWLDGWIEG